MINIICLIESLTTGGKERQLNELLHAMVTHEAFDITVVLMRDSISYDTAAFHDRITILPQAGVLRQYHAFKRLVKKIRPDIIHAWGLKPAVFANGTALFTGIKTINGSIRSAYPLPRNLKKNLLQRLVTHLSTVNVSNSLAGLSARHLREGKKNRVIYNGIDPISLHCHTLHHDVGKRWGIATTKVVGMVANFTSFKDHHTFFRAAIAILQQRSDITFMAVGEGPLREPMKEMYHHKNIIYTGKVDHPEQLIAIFDVGVLASLIEGCPNAVLEYMAMGKPVVATDGGGTPELFTDGVEGFLVPMYDSTALAQKIIWLLENPNKACKMGQQGVLRISSAFNYDTMTQKYIDLYKALCAG